jgi:Tfp pilus assembly protein FimV
VPVPATVPAAPAPATTPATAPAPTPAARRGVRATRGWHVIQRGESLWSIASERLPDDASTAEIAREVERLWALNEDRIGTGDRNVLLAGTRIKL